MKIIKNDSDVGTLVERNVTVIEDVHAYLGDRVEEEVYLYETIHGFIATIHIKDGLFMKGSEGTASRMDADDIKFYARLASRARWFSFATDGVTIGLSRTISELK